MVKTLSISIDDVNKDNGISISGTLDETQFNKTIVLTIGPSKVALDSEELARALAEVVNFQRNAPPISMAEKYGV